MPYEYIALVMFMGMMAMLMTGQRVFAGIGFVAVVAAIMLWGDRGGYDIAFTTTIKLMNWYPMLTLPMFVWMGYVMSEARLADDLYKMFHVWFGPIPGGLAIGTILLMVLISAMNGLSVAGLAIGATIALPELLKRGYDKRMVTGIIQGGSSLGILVPPSIVLVLYSMIARQPVGQVWLAGIFPGLLMAGFFLLYVVIRCGLNPSLGPALSREERAQTTWAEKISLLRAGILPVVIFASMMGPFVMGYVSLVEASVIGALIATLVALLKGRITKKVWENCIVNTLGVTCMFMWILLAAMAFGAVFDGLGAVKTIEAFFLEDLGLGPWGILILMQVSFLVMGMFLDDTAMLVIVAPLYIPLAAKLDLGMPPQDVLIWYGILYTITCQVAYITPPFGYNLFLMRAMAPDHVSLSDIYRSIVPIVAIMILTLAVIMVFPEIALWLPHQVYGQ
ncbi:TRAP transporter large permease subunit [Xinfangfangia sp. D13-10-4-6]|uniref:TRAP transporter large permease n=1 Tax=Pseudogemmobacter hezensis TaxID=2737662 RepID=UPI0015538D52|nr:TRAP transporter large permease subunit [Pseudogemmobacter hezensis]NPD16438.1 TRAP transporter large permease subunit [Pseudogemmobacter hezensis]